jgi:dihydrodipicolinate synthase/N-acetylneuraminate lyase
LKAGDVARAEELRQKFLPLEDLRDAASPLRVLHAAVTASGVADTGPLLPFLSNIEDQALLERIGRAARELFALNETALARAA